jgi:hypothetical protein
VHNCEWAYNKKYVKSILKEKENEEYGDFDDDDDETSDG